MYTGKGALLSTFPFFDPGDDVLVIWSRGGSSPKIIKRLDPNFLWSGSNTDTRGWFGRYGGGDAFGLQGHHITTYGSHGGTDSGEAFAILQAALAEAFPGIGMVLPPPQAIVDFGLVNSEDGKPLDVSYWMKLLGKDSPVSQEPRPKPKPKPPVTPPIPTPTPTPTPTPVPTPQPQPPSPPTSGRTINVDFNCTVQKPSHSIDLPPNTTRLDGDLLIVISEDPRQLLSRHFTDPETGISALNVGNVRVSFFALRGNNTGNEKKPKRKLRWGFTQGAQFQARVEGDIISKDGAKDGQLAGPRLSLPGVHRIRFTHLAATGVTTFTFSDNTKMKVTSKETGTLNSAKFWLGTNLPADLNDTSYIPPIGRITGSLTVNGSGAGTGTETPPITPIPPTTQPQPTPATNLIEFVRDLNAKAHDLSNQTQALLNMVEKS